MEINYLTLKLVHIISSIIFVGNIVVTALWKLMADRTRHPSVVAFGQRQVNVTDFIFTSIGGGVMLVTGLMMSARFAEEFWTIPWLAWGLGLFLGSTLLWMLVLIPIQVKQAQLVRSFAKSKEIPVQYWRLERIWLASGVIAISLPLISMYFMVFKPT